MGDLFNGSPVEIQRARDGCTEWLRVYHDDALSGQDWLASNDLDVRIHAQRVNLRRNEEVLSHIRRIMGYMESRIPNKESSE